MKYLSEKQVEEIKAAKLAAQWPKVHKHANGYDGGSTVAFTPEAFDALDHAYTRTDDFCTVQARHCPCESTLEVMTAIHDLAAE